MPLEQKNCHNVALKNIIEHNATMRHVIKKITDPVFHFSKLSEVSDRSFKSFNRYV